MFILVNNDGTSMDDIPQNPLEDKWRQNNMINWRGNRCNDVLGYYEDGRPIVNYSCVLCKSSNCYLSDFFHVPEEDKEIYEKYKEDLKQYHKLHGNFLLHTKEK